MESLHLNKEELKLAQLVDYLNVNFNIETKRNRIILQKITYLASKLGYHVNDNYKFSWYINGPYCPELTRTYYSLRGQLLNGVYDFIDNKISKEDKLKVQNLENILNEEPENMDRADWLELIASIAFLYDYADDKERIRNFLKNDKNKTHLKLDTYFDIAYPIVDKYIIQNKNN